MQLLVTRKRAAAALGTVLAMCALAVALFTSSAQSKEPASRASSATTAAASVPRKDTLVVGQFRTPTGDYGNVYVTASDPFTSDGVNQLVYEPLFYLNPNSGKEEPMLGTSFSYNKANTALTIHLRKGVEWSDGKPLTSADAVFTMNKILTTHPTPWRAGNIQASVASIHADGKYAFTLKLKQPNPRFIQTDMSTSIYTSNFLILPEHIFKGQNFKTFSDYNLAKGWPVGTGPYRVSAANQNTVTYTRDANWWGAKTGFAALPAPQKVVFTNPGPEDTDVSGLESNQLDYSGLSEPTVAGFISAHQKNPKLENWNGNLGYDDACPFSLTMNTQQSPWDNPQMRWALNDSINKQAFSEIFNSPGPASPAETTLPAYSALNKLLSANANAALLKQYPTDDYSPSNAAKILQAQGYSMQGGKWMKNGQPLTLTIELFNSSAAGLGPAWGTVATLLQQELTQAGFTVTLDPVDFSAIIADRTKGTGWDAISWFECGSLSDPWATLNRYTNALGNDNPVKWTNTQYDSLVAKIGELPTTSTQIPSLFTQAFKIYLQQLPVIPLVQRPEPVVMNTTYWTGWPTSKDPYESPAGWTQYFGQVVLHLKPAKG
jgi:peptide/nickel transport system substrate-binding protein